MVPAGRLLDEAKVRLSVGEDVREGCERGFVNGAAAEPATISRGTQLATGDDGEVRAARQTLNAQGVAGKRNKLGR